MAETPLPKPKRRLRYRGRNPRRFEEKYKEHQPERYAEDVAKVIASGKTPAGTHRPILVAEILAALRPQPGEFGVDATLGYGGHAQELLRRIQPGGRLLALDVDPIELPKTEARLRAAAEARSEDDAKRRQAAEENVAKNARITAEEKARAVEQARAKAEDDAKIQAATEAL